MEVPDPTDTVEETACFVCLGWNTGEEVKHSLRQGTSILKDGGLVAEEWLWMELLETVQGNVSVLKAHHVIAPILGKSTMTIAAFLSKQLL